MSAAPLVTTPFGEEDGLLRGIRLPGGGVHLEQTS